MAGMEAHVDGAGGGALENGELESNPLLDDSNKRRLYLEYREEVVRVGSLAGPISSQAALVFVSSLVSLAFAGHLGGLALSQAVLASSCYNITGAAVLLGLASGMETLCGQAYGAGNYGALGIVLQQAVVISTAVFALILALWTQVHHLLLAAGQRKEIVDGAVMYLLLSAPALYCYVIAECLKRYLLAQARSLSPFSNGVVTPATIVTACSAALSPLYNWLLVDYFQVGLAGAALANDAVQATVLVGLVSYVVWRDRRLKGTPLQTWPGWSRQCLHGWWPYLKLALPTVGACCLEWWLYEGLILIAGWFPNADVAVAAMGVGFNTTALTYTISQGIGGAASTRVANELGSAKPLRAEKAAYTAIALETLLMLGIVAVGFGLRDVWAYLFTDDPEVVDVIEIILPVVFFSEIGDGLNCVCGGVMRGAGRQLLASILNLITYWGLGLPLSCVLGLHYGLGVQGLWWGLATTTTVQGLAMLATVMCFDWDQEAKAAAVLMNTQHDALGPESEALLHPASEAGSLDGGER
ncbi:MATE efflux family protein [Coccomyxa subellipsoidea C-169]|uniref:Protein DETOXIFICATION n=1 Tax=Coccomyxa subellipsoidea (strain C-169) TaxID=574566 RepID=I0Z2Z3_COCSC|nr:MATE efflux family protein [Coccomyxa subellipsoidea C-169]EIE25012.1 MATE efflux family protein [Coccomyxa subellipsoidea C-169]|eukprot:XP_005649556.1 MATE efflux family protein [Coccomyxa subellipsoidea C-169]